MLHLLTKAPERSLRFRRTSPGLLIFQGRVEDCIGGLDPKVDVLAVLLECNDVLSVLLFWGSCLLSRGHLAPACLTARSASASDTCVGTSPWATSSRHLGGVMAECMESIDVNV